MKPPTLVATALISITGLISILAFASSALTPSAMAAEDSQSEQKSAGKVADAPAGEPLADRALRLADKRSFPAARERWTRVRDEIYEEIMTRGWSAEFGTFVQSYDSDTLDASSLMMPLVFFVSPSDPKMLQTIDAINRDSTSAGTPHGARFL